MWRLYLASRDQGTGPTTDHASPGLYFNRFNEKTSTFDQRWPGVNAEGVFAAVSKARLRRPHKKCKTPTYDSHGRSRTVFRRIWTMERGEMMAVLG